MDILLLYILLFPAIVINNLTWNPEAEAHWRESRGEDGFDDAAWQEYHQRLIRWWAGDPDA